MTSTLYKSNNPPVKGSAFTFYVSLVSQADTDVFQTSVTLAAGDVQISIDGGAFANLTNLPVEIGTSGVLAVTVGTDQHTGDRHVVRFRDAAGDEWQDLLVAWDSVTAQTVSDGTGITLADNAITAAKIATDAGTEIGTAVWASSTRTLTQAAGSVVSTVSGTEITQYRGDTWSISLTGLGALTGYVSLDFTVKASSADSDNDAIFRIRKNASGTGDGLLRLNGAALVAPVVAADGGITINVEADGDITIALAARATDDLTPADGLVYDIQLITASGVTTISEGTFNVSSDITRAVS